MSDANWWLLRWLDRVLLNAEIEGTAFAAAHAPPLVRLGSADGIDADHARVLIAAGSSR